MQFLRVKEAGVVTRALVTGAGGFIGHHLVNYLVDKDYWVRGVDIKYPEHWATRCGYDSSSAFRSASSSPPL